MSYLKSYEYVIAIVRYGGFSQASEAIHIAQSALSRYIKKLESELGVELFDRSVIPIRLTTAGKCYLETGRELMFIEKQLKKQLDDIRTVKNTSVRIGISPTRSQYIMPLIAERFYKSGQHSKLIIEEYTSSELNQLLMQGEIDLMISWLDSDTSFFSNIELFEEEILMAVPIERNCKTDNFIDIIRNHQLIGIGKGQALSNFMQSVIEMIDVPLPQTECKSIETALAFVRRGLGITFVPSYIAYFGSSDQNRGIEFLSLPIDKYPKLKSLYKRKICLFYRKGQFLSKAEQDFITCAQEVSKLH